MKMDSPMGFPDGNLQWMQRITYRFTLNQIQQHSNEDANIEIESEREREREND